MGIVFYLTCVTVNDLVHSNTEIRCVKVAYCKWRKDTQHLWNSNVYIPNTAMQNTLCRKRDQSSLQNGVYCKTLHKWFWAYADAQTWIVRAETLLQHWGDASHCCSPTKGVRRWSTACIGEMDGVLQKCMACEGHSEKSTLLYLPNYKASIFFS